MNNKLEVWKVSHELTLSVYKLTEKFPKSEHFGLTNQVRRSAASIGANIVEGQARQYKKEYLQFLYIAKGSVEETNYHLYLAKYLENITNAEYEEINNLCVRVKMMLHKLIQSLKV